MPERFEDCTASIKDLLDAPTSQRFLLETAREVEVRSKISGQKYIYVRKK